MYSSGRVGKSPQNRCQRLFSGNGRSLHHIIANRGNHQLFADIHIFAQIKNRVLKAILWENGAILENIFEAKDKQLLTNLFYTTKDFKTSAFLLLVLTCLGNKMRDHCSLISSDQSTTMRHIYVVNPNKHSSTCQELDLN